MNTKNVTRDLILMDLYHKDVVYYFSPSSIFLSAITSSMVINLILNKKVFIEDDLITIRDNTSRREYNQLLLNYIIDNNITSLKKLAQDLFLDNDLSFQLFELALKELLDEKLIEVNVKKHLIINRSTVKLVDENSVRKAYEQLFETLYHNKQSQEIIALALIIDTFFEVDDYFDESEHETIQAELSKLKEEDIYRKILVFKEVIDEFYSLIVQRSTNYFGV